MSDIYIEREYMRCVHDHQIVVLCNSSTIVLKTWLGVQFRLHIWWFYFYYFYFRLFRVGFIRPTCKLVQWNEFGFKVQRVKRLMGLKVHQDDDNGVCDVWLKVPTNISWSKIHNTWINTFGIKNQMSPFKGLDGVYFREASLSWYVSPTCPLLTIFNCLLLRN